MKKVLALLGSICILLFLYAGNGGIQAAETFDMTFGGYSIGGYTSEERQKTVTATVTDENTVEMEGSTEISAVYFGVAATDLTIASPSAITVVKAENEQKVECEAAIVRLPDVAHQKVNQYEIGYGIGVWIKENLTEGVYTITIPENSVKSRESGNEEFRIILHVNEEAGAKYEKGILSWDKVEGAKYYKPVICADSMEGLTYSDGLNERQLTMGTAASDGGGFDKESIFLEKENRIIMDWVNGCEILVDGHTYIYEILAYNEEEKLIASQEAKYTYHEPKEKLSIKDGGELVESKNGLIFHIREDAQGREWRYTYRYLYYCEPNGIEFSLLTRKGGMIGREFNITSYMTKAGTYKVRMIVGNQEGFSDFSEYSNEYTIAQEKEEEYLIMELDAVNLSKLTEKETDRLVELLRRSTKGALETILTSAETKDKIAAIEEKYRSFHNISSDSKAELSDQVKEKVSEIKGIGIAFNIKPDTEGVVKLVVELVKEEDKKKVDITKYKDDGIQFDFTLPGIANEDIFVPIMIEMDLPVGLSKTNLRVLHYLGEDTHQVIIPVIRGNKVFFPITHFSTFVFVNEKSNGSSSGGNSSGSRNNYSSSAAVISPKNQWEASAGIWKYHKADGTYAKREWQLINGKWYHFSADAKMDTGWQFVNGKWYYMDVKNGDMKTDWQQINGKWYYLKPQGGDMQIGWLYWNQKWFYLKKDGDMATGWQQVGGKWYYMTTYGDCLLHTVTPDGYQVDENGAWIQ